MQMIQTQTYYHHSFIHSANTHFQNIFVLSLLGFAKDVTLFILRLRFWCLMLQIFVVIANENVYLQT